MTIGTLGKILSDSNTKQLLFEMPVGRKGYVDFFIFNDTGDIANCKIYVLNDTDSVPATNINIIYNTDINKEGSIGKIFVNSGYKIYIESDVSGVIFSANGSSDPVV